MKKVFAALAAATALLASPAFSQEVNWIKLPDGMSVERVTDDHYLAFLVSLNSYKISSFHVETNLTGEQHYATRNVGWTYYRDGDPRMYVTSYSTENWDSGFSAESGSFGWQNAFNVSNLGDPSYRLVFRIDNPNFSDSTTFNYYIDQVPEPGTYLLMLTGLGALGVISRRRKHKAIPSVAFPTSQPQSVSVVASKAVQQ